LSTDVAGLRELRIEVPARFRLLSTMRSFEWSLMGLSMLSEVFQESATGPLNKITIAG